METPNTAYYIPNLVRNDDQADVTVEVVPVNANGVRGEAPALQSIGSMKTAIPKS